MKSVTLLLLLSATQIAVLFSYPNFQQAIPNGDRVPNPCGNDTNDTWPGVGHQLMGGSGPRNPFGQAFERNGEQWTVALCQMDSDGDGRTNGQELGDPDCTWKVNGIPKTTQNLSHPGVCEPMGSQLCLQKNSWLKACPKPFGCPAFKEPGVKKLEVRIPRTRVPAQETTYMCIGFEFPNDTKYHVIGDEPIIDNVNIMHHMILYGCTAPFDDPKRLTEPWECKMAYQNCQTMISVWGVGKYGTCNSKEFGFPIGVYSIKYAMLQLHWNNPQLKDDYVDNSGLAVYYTDKLRQYDGGILMVGQNYLELPPGQPEIVQEGTCKKSCSEQIQPKTIYIVSSILHMHLQGKSGAISILRDGKEPQVINEDQHYDYNTPTIIDYEKHIEFKAGDEIKTKCVFQTLDKNITTYYGEGTQDEMCFGFIIYYPYVPKFDVCGEWKDLAACSLTGGVFDIKCDTNAFNLLLSDDAQVFGQLCTLNCTNTCMHYISTIKATGCLDLSTASGQFIYKWYPGVSKLHEFIQYCDSMHAPGESNLTTPSPVYSTRSPMISISTNLFTSSPARSGTTISIPGVSTLPPSPPTPCPTQPIVTAAPCNCSYTRTGVANVTSSGSGVVNVTSPSPGVVNDTSFGSWVTNVTSPGSLGVNVTSPGPGVTNVTSPGPAGVNVTSPGPGVTNVTSPGPVGVNVTSSWSGVVIGTTSWPVVGNATSHEPGVVNMTSPGLGVVNVTSPDNEVTSPGGFACLTKSSPVTTVITLTVCCLLKLL